MTLGEFRKHATSYWIKGRHPHYMWKAIEAWVYR